MEKEAYEVIVAGPAQSRYQTQVLPYLFENFSEKRVEEIDHGIFSLVESLGLFPLRGATEKYLKRFNQEFRFVLYPVTHQYEIKIVYFVDLSASKVYVTDFFPTRMNPESIMTSSKDL